MGFKSMKDEESVSVRDILESIRVAMDTGVPPIVDAAKHLLDELCDDYEEINWKP